MLLIHLLLSSVSVECTTCDSFLRLFRNYVYYHFIFPKINKRGVGIRAGELENFSKINKRGGRLFGTRDEYVMNQIGYAILFPLFFITKHRIEVEFSLK